MGNQIRTIRVNEVADPAREGSLASRLRYRRKQLDLTLQEVADAAGLSVGFISQVERGLTAPSLSSLTSIAKVLGKETSDFLQQPRSEASYTRHERRRPYQIEGQDMAYERISSSFPGQKIHSVMVHMPPGYRAQQIRHEGEEIVFILQGSVTSELDGKTVTLHAGDSIHYLSTRPHCLWNHTDRETIVLWVGTMDIFGEHSQEVSAPKTAQKHIKGEEK